MYTLSSPTVLATDAATRPDALRNLAALGSAFRLTQDGAFALALAHHKAEPESLGIAWGMLEAMSLNAPTMPETLRAVRVGKALDPAELAGFRFGNALHIAALVAREAVDWPDGTAARVPGVGRVPASAAAAAAWVAAPWAEPELDAEHVQVLRAPFESVAAQMTPVAEPAPGLYGPRGESVLELIDQARSGAIDVTRLAAVTWSNGVWTRAMHQAAWACLHEGRLRAQMRAVLDVTYEFIRSGPDLTPEVIRVCLPTLHALVVQRLVADVLEPQALAELTLADGAL